MTYDENCRNRMSTIAHLNEFMHGNSTPLEQMIMFSQIFDDN